MNTPLNLASLPATRAAAITQNSKWYFTGKPCPHGHVAPRFTSQGVCMGCARTNAMKGYTHTTQRRRGYSDLAGFIATATDIHCGRYSYTDAIYTNAHTPLAITCAAHGNFMQSPTNHVAGKGCPKCKTDSLAICKPKPFAQFVLEARALWKDAFDYDGAAYVNSKVPITFKCREHSIDVTQTPTNHLLGKNPCTKCNHMRSAGEDAVAEYLSIFTRVVRRDRTVIAPKELDILLPDVGLAVEYCGMYWHSVGSHEEQRARRNAHKEKFDACAAAGIRLITLYESEWLGSQKAIKRLLRNAAGKMQGRLMARKCEIRGVSIGEAREFYNEYHPQGGAGNGEHYGLFWKEKLVACMRFTYGANDRGASRKPEWTLTRYATRINVAGGASRLFKAFIKDKNPECVKSFSDSRFFNGAMYEQLGFELEETSAPDYQVWSQKIGLRPKSHYQRRKLQGMLNAHGVKDTFDPEKDKRTEMEMTFAMGARRIYDCGKKRWVWKAKHVDTQ